MGIRHLNKFFREHAPSAIKYINLGELSGKKIAVDISIYMYKYASDEVLIENIYLMLSLFKHYRIIPIFIFDGKPPIEKRELLRQRYNDKVVAEAEYNRLSALLEQESLDRGDLVSEMELLKKKIIYLTKKQIANVKTLIHAFGATYYDAPNEADELCALLVLKNKAWACMSEDMDMFVYGVPRIIRYFSLLNHTIVLYNTSSILEELKMTQKEFSEVCILSGTDYNLSSSHSRQAVVGHGSLLHDSVWLFQQYKNYCYTAGFYDWLLKDNLIGSDEYVELNHIYKMFVNETAECVDIANNIKTTPDNLLVCKDKLRSILEDDGFIYK